jgi:hypothetical protein
VRHESINDIWQNKQESPDSKKDVVRDSRDRDHSSKLEGKRNYKQDVSDRQPNFGTLLANKAKHKYRRQPRGERNGICSIGEQ